jgi:hypothetical protein
MQCNGMDSKEMLNIFNIQSGWVSKDRLNVLGYLHTA